VQGVGVPGDQAEACGHARAIAADGTSADRQMAVFAAARRSGSTERAALSAVVEHLANETAAGTTPGPGGHPNNVPAA
jgi:carboxylate-amine ligase